MLRVTAAHLCRKAVEVGHRTEYLLDTVSHRELVDYLLRRIVEADLPRIVAFCVWDLDDALILLLAQIMEQILMQARVLDMIWSDLVMTNKWSCYY